MYGLVFHSDIILNIPNEPSVLHGTMIFNTFVLMQLVNQVKRVQYMLDKTLDDISGGSNWLESWSQIKSLQLLWESVKYDQSYDTKHQLWLVIWNDLFKKAYATQFAGVIAYPFYIFEGVYIILVQVARVLFNVTAAHTSIQSIPVYP